MKTVGFIGTGGMGSGMAANLHQGRLSSGRERSQARAGQGPGGRRRSSSRTRPKQWPNRASSCFRCCRTTMRCRAVGLGKGGLAEATTGTKVWIDFSSIDKETIVSVSDELKQKGWTVVDASAGGVEEVAAAGDAGALAFGLQGVVRRASADIQGDGQIDSSRRRARQCQAGQERHGDVGRGPTPEPC